MNRALRLAFVAVVGCSRVEETANGSDASADAASDTWPETRPGMPNPPPVTVEGGGGDVDVTGKTCVSRAECDPDGEEIGYCTNAAYAVGPLDPTSICLLFGPETCAPSDATMIRLCDKQRGVCRDAGSGYTTCEAKCEFAADGTWLTQCAGKNACNLLGASSTGTTLGHCKGGCQLDADCPTGSKCDPTLQYCVYECTIRTARASGRALPPTCTQNCVVGGAATCPSGFTCDPIAKVAVPNGVAGHCLRNCIDATSCAAHEVCEATPGLAQKTCRPK